jgi:hypothetical protein
MEWCSRVVVGLCCSAILIGCLNIFGWLSGIISYNNAYAPPLMFMSSFYIILISMAVLLKRNEHISRSSNFIANTAVLFIIAFNIITLIFFETNTKIYSPFLTRINLILLCICV